MLPTAACHLLPFRSQTSHQLPPLLQSQTPFVSHLSLLSMFTTFPDLLSSLEYRAGKVQACWSGQTAENWSKAQNSPLLQCVVHVGRLCDNSSPDPPLKKQRQSTAVAGDRRLCQMAKRRRWSSWQAPVAGVSDKQDPMPVLSPLLCHRRREPALGVVGCFSQNQRHSHYHQCHI